MAGNEHAWVRDAWMTGLDALTTAGAVTGALLVHSRWLAALAGVWAVLAVRQGWVAVRTFRRSGG